MEQLTKQELLKKLSNLVISQYPSETNALEIGDDVISGTTYYKNSREGKVVRFDRNLPVIKWENEDKEQRIDIKYAADWIGGYNILKKTLQPQYDELFNQLKELAKIFDKVNNTKFIHDVHVGSSRKELMQKYSLTEFELDYILSSPDVKFLLSV